MKFPQHILVIVGGKRNEHIALNRAIQLAQFYDIKLHLLSCVYDPGTDLSPLISQEHRKTLKQEMMDNRLAYLEQLKKPVEAKGIQVTTQVIWHRKIQKAVMRACSEVNPDLVIKRISDKAPSLNPFTMPVDWQLLRKCPAPLLLVKDLDWKIPSPVLAAVDAAAETAQETSFNHQIISYAKLLSRLTDDPTHVVTTHITPSLDNATTIPGFDLESLKNEVNDFNQQKLDALVADHNVSNDCLHIIEGLAEDRIPQLAQQIGAQIVVMGTVCRAGLTGAFMGNTAERVLTQLQCEVLALKPPKSDA
ncbi:universal stress protein UspE [Aliikangiella marina]|nr:universal stress protein UspE [Aliikangiella marina]